MQDHSGNKETSKIWLIADSPPTNWESKLAHPLDPRHPAVHNIWTPISDRINDVLFYYGLRLNTKSLFIRNAVNDASIWDEFPSDRLNNSIGEIRKEFQKYSPTMVITFGSRAFDAVTQAASNEKSTSIKKWSSHQIGEIFISNINNFNPNKINIIPLLHTSVSRRYFLEGQADFCGYDRKDYLKNELDDYFTFAGKKIACVLNQEYFNNLDSHMNPFVKKS